MVATKQPELRITYRTSAQVERAAIPTRATWIAAPTIRRRQAQIIMGLNARWNQE
jgi:hypothetical protein